MWPKTRWVRYPAVVARGQGQATHWVRSSRREPRAADGTGGIVPHVLVLNASYEPLGVVPLRRALVLVLNEKAICREDSGALLHSATRVIPAPSVGRL